MATLSWGRLYPPIFHSLNPGQCDPSPGIWDRGTLLGAGRSGRVYQMDTQVGPIARKVFFGDAITHSLHYLFFGAPNPYIWNPDAVACAYYRRNILAALVSVWFGDRLRLSRALGMGWDPQTQAHYLDTEFVEGRPVALCQPFRTEGDRELPEQVHTIMVPLQRHLQQSGFDGLLWQVGKGNPSALNNLLLTDDPSQPCRFAWIDLESGVPALFPLNPLALLTFYVPQALRRGQALFDDVDLPKLRQYLRDQRPGLEDKLGPKTYADLLKQTDYLAEHQARWKSLRRLEGCLRYHQAKGRLTEAEVQAALKQPWRWYGPALGRLARKLGGWLLRLPQRMVGRLARIDYRHWLAQVTRSCLSHGYRMELARNYVAHRVEVWADRGQLRHDDAQQLIQRLDCDRSSDYISDFCVHLAIKLPVKLVRFALLPVLYGAGLINGWLLAVLLVAGGLIARQIYTLGRCLEALIKGQSVPWVALAVGFIPFLSSAAYPCQMVYSATRRQRDRVAQFILYDGFTRLGSWVPGWGGPDTLVEHWFNRAAHHLIRGLRHLSRSV